MPRDRGDWLILLAGRAPRIFATPFGHTMLRIIARLLADPEVEPGTLLSAAGALDEAVAAAVLDGRLCDAAELDALSAVVSEEAGRRPGGFWC